MLDKDSCIPHIISKLKKIKIGERIELRPYKRNRVVVIEKLGEENFKIEEDGFYKETYNISQRQLQRELKKLLKKEFPRSHKIRIYTFQPDEVSPEFKKI